MSFNDPNTPQVVYVTAPPKKGHGKVIALVTVIAVLFLAVGGVAAYVVFNKQSAVAGDSAGEVFLEPAASMGQDPYSSDPLGDDPDPEIAKPATDDPPPSTTKVTTTAASGGQPGLYGGTQNSAICSAKKMIAFMQTNPAKAAAWVAALNADPDLRWTGGTLTVADIPTYLKQLTPIVLVSDTRVTNHGYVNGRATMFQSILQKGSAVFIDAFGVPRVRCLCGNPLRAPIAVKQAPKYQGRSWPDFNPSKVTVVQPNPTAKKSFDVRIPATPNGKVTPVAHCPVTPEAIDRGLCNPDGTLPGSKPSKGAPTTKPGPTTNPNPTTNPSPTTTPSPTTKPGPTKPPGKPLKWPLAKTGGTIHIKGGKVNSQGYHDWLITFSGYEPYRRVTYTCTHEGVVDKLTSASDKNGVIGANFPGHCFSLGTLTVRDHLGNVASKG